MFWRKILIAMAFCLFFHAAIAATGDPKVEVTPPPSYKARKVALFPLSIPSYLMRAATIPIGAAFKLLEDKKVVEKSLDFMSNKDKTFWVYPLFQGGAGSNFGGGIGMRHTDFLHKGYLLGASYKINLQINQSASFSFGKPDAYQLWGRSLSYSLGANFLRSQDSAFYGIGNGSSESNLAEFGFTEFMAGLTVVYTPFNHFSIAPYFGTILSIADTKRSSDSNPSVQDAFPITTLTGFDNKLNYFDIGLQFAHDTRNSLQEATAGGYEALTLHYFNCANKEEFNYFQYNFDIRKYFPLYKPRQALMVRTAWNFQNTTGGKKVPFWRLSTLDANNFLRGFNGGRFRDKDSGLFNFEYRFPVWNLFNGVLFYDTGTVFSKPSDFTFSGFKHDIGAGIHFRIPKIALFRFESAYGGEGVKILFGASKPL